jgi:hypothetical protein
MAINTNPPLNTSRPANRQDLAEQNSKLFSALVLITLLALFVAAIAYGMGRTNTNNDNQGATSTSSTSTASMSSTSTMTTSSASSTTSLGSVLNSEVYTLLRTRYAWSAPGDTEVEWMNSVGGFDRIAGYEISAKVDNNSANALDDLENTLKSNGWVVDATQAASAAGSDRRGLTKGNAKVVITWNQDDSEIFADFSK